MSTTLLCIVQVTNSFIFPIAFEVISDELAFRLSPDKRRDSWITNLSSERFNLVSKTVNPFEVALMEGDNTKLPEECVMKTEDYRSVTVGLGTYLVALIPEYLFNAFEQRHSLVILSLCSLQISLREERITGTAMSRLPGAPKSRKMLSK